MGRPRRAFLERLRTFEDVLEEVSAGFANAYRVTPILDVNPPRVVSVAVERRDVPSNPKVFVTASDRGDVASARAKAALRNRIGKAVQRLAATQLPLAEAAAGGPPAPRS